MNKVHRHSRVSPNAVGAGLTLAVSVAMFAYGGLWLDEQFGTKPWCMLVLVLCGILGGVLHVIRVLAPEAWPFGELPSRSQLQESPKKPPQKPQPPSPRNPSEPSA